MEPSEPGKEDEWFEARTGGFSDSQQQAIGAYLTWYRERQDYDYAAMGHGESTWGAHVPVLPGCAAVGETRDEVVRLIREAIALHIEGLRREGLPVPKPTSKGTFVEVEAA